MTTEIERQMLLKTEAWAIIGIQFGHSSGKRKRSYIWSVEDFIWHFKSNFQNKYLLRNWISKIHDVSILLQSLIYCISGTALKYSVQM